MINEINKAFQVSGKVTDEYRAKLRGLLTDMQTSWNNLDESAFNNSLKQTIDLITQNQRQVKELSKDSQEYTQVLMRIEELQSAIGAGKVKTNMPNAKVNQFYIDPSFRSELEYIVDKTGNLSKLLTNLYGRGNWTFDASKGFENLRNYIDALSSYSDVYNKWNKNQFGGNNQADFLVETANKINQLKSALSFKQTQFESWLNLGDVESVNKAMEQTIANIIKLKGYGGDAENFLHWFEPIGEEANAATLSINNLGTSVQKAQNLLNGAKSNNNYFFNNEELLRSIKLFDQEEDAVATLESKFKQLSATVSSVERIDQNGFLKGFTVDVKSATGEIEKFNYAWKNIGTKEQPDYRYVLTNITAANSGVEKLAESQRKFKSQVDATITGLQSQAEKIKSAYSDVNSAKHIQNTGHQTQLADQYQRVTDAINILRNADNTTMASMKANAQKEITALESLVKQLQNAEYAATSLRTKDIGTIKVNQQNDLNKFIAQVSGNSKVFELMKQDVDNLKISLNSITDSTSLTKYLNQLDNAKTKFTSLKALYSSIAGYDKQLDNLAKSWQKQGIYAGNIQKTVESLKASLANVTTADGLTAWIGDFNSQIGAISDLPVKVAEYRNQLNTVRDEWQQQGIYIGEIANKAASLARSLPNIKKPEKFDIWVKEWTELNNQATNLKANLDGQVASQNKIYEIQAQIAKLNPQKDTAEITRLNEKLNLEQETFSSLKMQADVFNNLITLEEREEYITNQTAVAREKLAQATARASDRENNKQLSEQEKLNTSINQSKEKLDSLSQSWKNQGIYIGEVERKLEAFRTALDYIIKPEQFANWTNNFKDLTAQVDSLKLVQDKIKELNSLMIKPAFKNNASNADVIKARADINALIGDYQKLKTQLQGNITPEGLRQIEATLTTLNSRFNTAKDSAENLQRSIANTNGQDKLIQKTELLIARIEAYKRANSNAMKMYGGQFESMLSELRSGKLDNIGVDRISRQFQVLRQEINATGKTGKTFFQSMIADIAKFAKWMSMTYFISTFTRSIRTMVTSVVELDTALVDLKKTFKGTESDLENFYISANQTAKDLGVTTKEVIEAASSWSRLGFNTKQAATDMAKATAIFKTISPGMTMEQATEGLTSVVKAYDINTSTIVDDLLSKINIVGNNFAVSNTDIIEGLKRSSSAMKLMGTSLEKNIALFTAGNEIIQDADTMGVALRSIAMRVRGYDEETGQLSEDLEDITGKVIDLTKVASNNNKGISLFTDTSQTEYKDLFEYLKQISEILPELQAKDKQELLELLFGKMRISQGSALLDNFSAAEEALDEMANSQGNAMAEMEIAYESITYKINEFKETLVGLGQTIFKQDLLKDVISGGTKVLDILNDIVKAIGTIPTILAGITIGKSLKNVGELKNTPPYAPLQLCA